MTTWNQVLRQTNWETNLSHVQEEEKLAEVENKEANKTVYQVTYCDISYVCYKAGGH